MKKQGVLLLAALLLAAALLRLLFPGQAEALRAWAENSLGPGLEDRAEALGRSLSGGEARVPVSVREDGS